MHYSHPSTFWSSLSVPSSWNWEWRKKILRQRFGRRREKCFLVSGVLNFSMCQRKRSKNYQLSLMRPFSVGLKVFFSGCGFEFSWFFSRQRWKIFPSATHALEAIGSNAIFLRIPSLIPLQDHLFLFSFLVLHDLYLQKHMFTTARSVQSGGLPHVTLHIMSDFNLITCTW